jgi:hypothetical protein
LGAKHLAALTDQKNAQVAVINLDAEDVTSSDALVWEWSPTTANGFAEENGYSHSVDEAILRYSETLQSYVVCVTSSAGFAGVAEYPSGKAVWYTCVLPDDIGPHSIEYLPNGNVAVACSGNQDYNNGTIRIYTVSAGINSSSYVEASLYSAHGVLWDDENQLLWALGDQILYAYEIGGDTSSPTITRVEGLGGELPNADSGGHDLTVSGEDSNILYVSGNHAIYAFDKEKNTFASVGESVLFHTAMKTFGTYADGVAVRSAAANVYKSHDTNLLEWFVPDQSNGYTAKTALFEDRAFYKARIFSAAYHEENATKNINLTVGADASELYINWYQSSLKAGKVQYSAASNLVDGVLSSYQEAAASDSGRAGGDAFRCIYI